MWRSDYLKIDVLDVFLSATLKTRDEEVAKTDPVHEMNPQLVT